MECGKPFAIVENMTLAVKSRVPTGTSNSLQNTQEYFSCWSIKAPSIWRIQGEKRENV